MSEVVALFPAAAPPPDPDRFAVDRRIRCTVTGRTGSIRMVRAADLFVIRLDPCRMPVPGGRPPSAAEPAGEMEELPAVELLRRGHRLEPLHPALDPQVVAYVRGRRAGEQPAPGKAIAPGLVPGVDPGGWCLVRNPDGRMGWVRESER